MSATTHSPYPTTHHHRVWVFPTEIPDGIWGGGGRINTLVDIVGYVLDDPDKGRVHAERRLAKRKAAVAG